MSKITLEFDSYEDAGELKLALAAGKLYSSLWEFDQWLRNKLKYEELSEKENDLYQGVRDRLWEHLTENSIDLYDMEG